MLYLLCLLKYPGFVVVETIGIFEYSKSGSALGPLSLEQTSKAKMMYLVILDLIICIRRCW